MTSQTMHIHRRTIHIVDIGRYRTQHLSLRAGTGCDIMRGAVGTILTLAAGLVLTLAVVAFAPRNTVTVEIAAGSHRLAIADRIR